MARQATIAFAALLLAGASAVSAQYSATYYPGSNSLPHNSENGQSGNNDCGSGSSQDSMCQNAYLNSLEDFCLWAPPTPGGTIGDTERIEVSWCTQAGRGTRVIPSGTISGAHFVKTPSYVQIVGTGDFTKINVAAGDYGGELDPHGADGNGNPVGGLVFSTAFGGFKQMHEWMSFISSNDFCFRACNDGPQATTLCKHIYDVLGCGYNMPANYASGQFESCEGDDAEVVAVYTQNGQVSTFYQSDTAQLGYTPSAKPAPASSNCQFTDAGALGGTLVNAYAGGSGGNGGGRSSSSSSSSSSSRATPTTSSSASMNGASGANSGGTTNSAGPFDVSSFSGGAGSTGVSSISQTTTFSVTPVATSSSSTPTSTSISSSSTSSAAPTMTSTSTINAAVNSVASIVPTRAANADAAQRLMAYMPAKGLLLAGAGAVLGAALVL